MYLSENYIVFPEGDSQEIGSELPFDALVDLNGNPIGLPLPDFRVIAYRVVKIRREESTGIRRSYHYLELVPASELAGYL
jgi:hypothetical protein